MAYDLTKMQDITITEKPLLAEYEFFFTTQTLYNLPQFLASHPELKYKIFNAENWNRLAKSISDKGFSTQWFDNVAYNVGDLVYIYGTPNAIYHCLVANTNQNPTTGATYWQELNSVGGVTEKSLEGMWEIDFTNLYDNTNWRNFSYVGEWSATENYTQNNMVAFVKTYLTDYGTTLSYKLPYVAIADNVGQNPETATAYWVQVMQNNASIGFQLVDTLPQTARIGDIFILKV